MSNDPPKETPRDWDPRFLRARREAAIVLIAFFVWLCWTVGVSWRLGYQTKPGELDLLFGFPSWVVWGVLLPWISATLFSVVFALRYIRDDDLGETADTHEPTTELGNE